jgi:hypothetical protein
MVQPIIEVLMERDGLDLHDARKVLKECRDMVADGCDPEEVLQDELGLEPDYIFDLL